MVLPDLDPKDAFLVSDLPMSFTNKQATSSVTGAPSVANVPWLRKTEYISSTASTRALNVHEQYAVFHIVSVAQAVELTLL